LLWALEFGEPLSGTVMDMLILLGNLRRLDTQLINADSEICLNFNFKKYKIKKIILT